MWVVGVSGNQFNFVFLIAITIESFPSKCNNSFLEMIKKLVSQSS